MALSIFLLLALLAWPSATARGHYFEEEDEERVCAHQPPDADNIPPAVHLEEKDAVLSRSSWQNMRIKVVYDNNVERRLYKRERDLLKRVVDKSVQYWSKTLSVRPNQGAIRLTPSCLTRTYYMVDDKRHCEGGCKQQTSCGDFVGVPNEHLDECRACNDGRNCRARNRAGPGIANYDYVIYVSAVETETCKGSTLAYASFCQQEAALDRPIAGNANICPSTLANTKSEEQLIGTVKHELAHALGFSASLMPFFRDEQGQPRTHRKANGEPPVDARTRHYITGSSTVKQVQRYHWKIRGGTITKTVRMVVTPKVVEEVRKHFKCSDVEGAELEDQGGSGTGGSHWEKRLFYNEGMTGTSDIDSKFSRLTLALMEDSGWYMPDYSMADELAWGNDKGCIFAMKSCKENMENDKRLEPNSPRRSPFCTNADRKSACNHDKSAVGSCNLLQYTKDLERQHQHFDQLDGVPSHLLGRYGGRRHLADYCPMVTPYYYGDSGFSFCSNSKMQGGNDAALQFYSTGAKCFDGGAWKRQNCTHYMTQSGGAGCFGHECSGGKLNIVLPTGDRLTCDNPGQTITVAKLIGQNLHEGSVQCPPCSDLCGRSCSRQRSNFGGEKVGVKDSGPNCRRRG